MFLPQILLIMCHNPCHTSYALYYHNREFRLLILNWWINLVGNFIGCLATYNLISSCLKNDVINCSVINDLFLIIFSRWSNFFESYFVDRKLFEVHYFIVSYFPQIISRKSVGYFITDASLICSSVPLFRFRPLLHIFAL